MKHLFINLLIREGEMEHDHRVLHKTNCKSIEFAALWYAAHYWDDEIDYRMDDWFFVHGSTMAIKVDRVKEITEYEYNLMNRIIYENVQENNYFEIVHSGHSNISQREEIEINAGEYGKILIFQDDGKLGFIIDVYGNDDHHGTMAVWEEDLAPMSGVDDDPLSESNAPENFSMSELEDFVDEWGQTHDEICVELGYDDKDDGSSEMLLGDGYKWFERWQKWIPKTSSMYSEREQAIMDYILIKYC